ncbi:MULTISPECIES: low molecular weight protein-tyrosine-phosphatase [Mycetocola]|uniref:low molecular weight protein-tyrosine-phosphatase n=1 Tax=Mycetocola TaxID=76634 RepID=UPI00210812A5|nr:MULTISPECIES: low molecular weight protein-tyrosine-phosphatase [unclassified Mycetocola]MCS4277160.1 protein-tyrosine phosphatase [Mycetocola sp. BIGb0189]
MPAQPFAINFVCSGNICRSPMAEVILRGLAEEAGLASSLRIISTGTGDWHVGEQADHRTIASLARHGYDGSAHRAQKFQPEHYDEFDLLVALDRSHERVLRAGAPTPEDADKVALLLSFDSAQAHLRDVPDPYYADDAVFDAVFVMIRKACEQLFRQIQPAIRAGASR